MRYKLAIAGYLGSRVTSGAGLHTTRRLVRVKSASRLTPQPACIDHPHQQGAGAILRISQPIVQHSHDVEANVEPDKVGKRKRAHGMSHTEPKDLIDRLWRCDAFHHGIHSFVEQRHQHAVRDKAWSVVDLN